MIVKEFGATCAGCHEAQIEGIGRATSKGLEILAVPGLDVQTLLDGDVPIGFWPEDAEGEITPYMALLLSGDGGYDAARTHLADLDLLDLTDASDEQIAAVEDLAWSIKELIYDLTTGGVASLNDRLSDALGHELDSMELARLTNLLPADAVKTAAGHCHVNSVASARPVL